MRTHVLLATAMIVGLTSSPAWAQQDSDATNPGPSCAFGADNTIASQYVDRDYVLLSRKPVDQFELTLSCGDFTYYAWNSTVLSAKGKYGYDRYADALELGAQYKHLFDTFFGKLEVTGALAYADYYDFHSLRDNLVTIEGGFGLPFDLGDGFTLKPNINVIGWIGFGTIDDTPIVIPGIELDYDASETVGLVLSVSHAKDMAYQSSLWRAVGTVNYKIDDNWSVSGNISLTQRAGVGAGINIAWQY